MVLQGESLRGEVEAPPNPLVGVFTKRGANVKAGHKWSYLRLDHQLIMGRALCNWLDWQLPG